MTNKGQTGSGPAGAGDRKTAGPREGALRRAAALVGIVLLAGLYIVTFVLAVAGSERTAGMLRFCFGMTIFVPLFVWVIMWCAGRLFHKKTMASLDILDSNPEERRRMEEALARESETGDRQKTC